jgi:hypothetical protein
MPDIFRLIKLKRIDKALGIVEPDMATKPTLKGF